LRRKAVLCAGVACAIALLTPSPARAQSLTPPTTTAKHAKRELARLPCLPGISLICAADDVASTAVGAIGDAVGAGAGVAADAMFGGLVGWAAGGATWLIDAVVKQVDRSTRPAIGSAWFARRYAAMRQLAISLSVLFVLAAVLQAAIRRDLAMLLRSCLVALPLAMLLTFAAVTLVEAGLALTDALTATAVRGTGADTQSAFEDLGRTLSPGGAATPLPGLVLFLASLLAALLALVVWIELVLREAAIYVAVAFLPICLAAMTWSHTAHWARRLTEMLAAIILAKFTIAVTFAVAASMVGEARGGSGGLTAVLGGCAVLLIAALSPLVLLRLIPFAEQAAAGLSRGHVRSAVSSAPGAAATALLVKQAMFKNFGAGLASSGSAPAPARWTPPSTAAQRTGSKEAS
jgi:hypothetical protein